MTNHTLIAQTILSTLSSAQRAVTSARSGRAQRQAQAQLRSALYRLDKHVRYLTRVRLRQLKKDPQFGLLQSYSHRTRLFPETDSPYEAWYLEYTSPEGSRMNNYFRSLNVQSDCSSDEESEITYDWSEHHNWTFEMWNIWFDTHELDGFQLYRYNLLTEETVPITDLEADPALAQWGTWSFRLAYKSSMQYRAWKPQVQPDSSAYLSDCSTPAHTPRWAKLGDILTTVDITHVTALTDVLKSIESDADGI